MREPDPSVEEHRRRIAVVIASIVLVAIVLAGWIGACRAAERADRERTESATAPTMATAPRTAPLPGP